MDSLTFGTDTAKDKYQEFLEEYAEYKDDETSIKKAKNLFTTAWHLTDWTFKEYGIPNGINDLGDFRDTLYPNCESLKIMHDLTNASKHKTLSWSKANLKTTKKHLGAFSREFSDEFEKTYLELELNDGRKIKFENEIDKVKLFWDSYFVNK